MNKEDFLKRLDELLVDIPSEEKEEAISFYRNYFEDAGVENEEMVMKELGSPEQVAKTIKADLVVDGEYSKNGEYTERGYKDAEENKESIIKVEPSVHEEKQQTEGNMTDNQKSQQTYQNQQYQQPYQNQYQNSGYGMPPIQKASGTNVALLIIICIFALPVIFPLTITAFSVMFGLMIGFGAAGVGCIAGGVIAFITGIIKIGVLPGFGMLAAGTGLVCFGLGLLFVLLSVQCTKAFPLICKAVAAIFRAPFGTRRVMA